jgi:hypothetical protein
MQTRAVARERQVRLAERIGIHVGEIVIEEHKRGLKLKDVYGTETCARVMGLAEGDRFADASGVRRRTPGLERRRHRRVKGLSWLNHGPYAWRSKSLWKVRGHEAESALGAPAGSEKAQRQVSWMSWSGLAASVGSSRAEYEMGVGKKTWGGWFR